MVEQVKIVGTGIDTVKVNVKRLGDDGKPRKEQEIPERLSLLFQAWQEKAKENNKPLATSMTFHDARMLMFPNSAPAWRYILRNDCLELKIAPRLKIPMIAKATLSSSYLWSLGNVQDAIDEVKGLLYGIFGDDVGLQAAQLDMCVDVVGLALPAEWRHLFVTHALVKRAIRESEKDQEYYYGRTLETITFSGHGRPINLKIYNKTAEIKQRSPEKQWFFPLWKAHGWDGEQPVWRIEYAVERSGFREMDIDSITDAISNIKRLWQYCTCEWLRMVRPGPGKNRTRWNTDPRWVHLQHAFDDYGDKDLDGLGPLVRQVHREKNIDRGVAAIAGYATTLAAWCEMELDDDNCAAEMFSVIYDKVIERWQKTRTSPVDVVREKKLLYAQKA